METAQLTMTRSEAREMYEKYQAALHYGEAIDREVARAYRLLAQGKLLIKANESVRAAGLDAEGLPKLALLRADSKECFVSIDRAGRGNFVPKRRTNAKSTIVSFAVSPPPLETFPAAPWNTDRRASEHSARAVVPIVPLHLRPKHALSNYHILWEADWHAVPRDPLLLRHLGKGDLWLVVAMWDLTEVERAALQARV